MAQRAKSYGPTQWRRCPTVFQTQGFKFSLIFLTSIRQELDFEAESVSIQSIEQQRASLQNELSSKQTELSNLYEMPDDERSQKSRQSRRQSLADIRTHSLTLSPRPPQSSVQQAYGGNVKLEGEFLGLRIRSVPIFCLYVFSTFFTVWKLSLLHTLIQKIQNAHFMFKKLCSRFLHKQYCTFYGALAE